MLKTVGIQNTEEYCMLSTVGSFIYIQYLEILYVEHCGNIYLHTILGITLRWALWETLFTENTGDYFMLNTEKIYLHKILRNTLCWALLEDLFTQILRNTVCWALWEDLFTQNSEEYCMFNTGKIYLHKIRRNTLCWTLWKDLFTQNTEEYCTLNTGKIYLHKILRNTLCWTLWDVFTQHIGE